eukprot:COSAG06_NODE_3073_length_5891_cov_13.072514_2_plen_45_part_00
MVRVQRGTQCVHLSKITAEGLVMAEGKVVPVITTVTCQVKDEEY